MQEKFFELTPLFSQPIASFILNVDNVKILNFLKKIQYNENINFLQKNTYMSKSNKLFNKHKELKELKKECEMCINLYIKEILKNNFKFKILNSWATKTLPHGFSQIHHHANNLLSACYYPKYSEGFKITFHKNEGIDTFFELNKPEEYTIYNSKNWSILPREGTLLIFPSALKHNIDINRTNEDRFSLAFCVNPVGKFLIGSDNEVEFK
jgi:uncharacterized protein (TIGR02466 family)